MSYLLAQCDPVAGCGKTYPSDLSHCSYCGADSAFSQRAELNPADWGYDIETFPNIFTAVFVHAVTGFVKIFEISDRKNELYELIEFIVQLKKMGARGVGFNNLNFDYPVLHHITTSRYVTVDTIYALAMSIINGSHDQYRENHLFPQIDLFKIHHFDNKAKSTGLKSLEIVMRSNNVVDLPFPVGTHLNDEQKDILIKYNINDVNETLKFYVRSLSEIELREKLSKTYNIDMTNFSNTKIGSTILVSQLEKSGVQCYSRAINNRRLPRQTIYENISLGDVIFPYVKLERDEFNQIVDFFKNSTISGSLVGVFKNLSVIVDGFKLDFGVGGIHGSINSQVVHSDENYQIVDIDVTSFYPRVAIVNKLFPKHLGEQYCEIYNDIFEQRKRYKKGTPENLALKEALNASYGNSNNQFSPLYDPKYTVSTTINGQLLLCMLIEQLLKIPNLTMIQTNTDGLTFRLPHTYIAHMRNVCKWWESITLLTLEECFYNRMFIRDVNNYIAEHDDNRIKRKGCYDYNLQWHQNPSALVIAKAAESALINGEDIRKYITNHKDKFDFMIRAKIPRDSELVIRNNDVERSLQNVTRYYVSHDGGTLIKKSPPTGVPGTWKRRTKINDDYYAEIMNEIKNNSGELDSIGTPHDTRIHTANFSVHKLRELSLCADQLVTECANANTFDWGNLNYEYYVNETLKIVDPLRG